jgi:hypothetical protein
VIILEERKMHSIEKVVVLEGYRLELTFDDGTHGVADVSHLAGKGVFALWNDRSAFESVRVGEAGDLRWSDAVDLCPDALYVQVTGKSVKDVFPGVERESTHA